MCGFSHYLVRGDASHVIRQVMSAVSRNETSREQIPRAGRKFITPKGTPYTMKRISTQQNDINAFGEKHLHFNIPKGQSPHAANKYVPT
jgi:hypothetical protein